MKYSTAALLTAGILGAAFPAGAAANGLKMGDGRLHPSFELSSHFDSAVAAAIGRAGRTGLGASDLILHLKPGVRLDVPSSKFSLALGARADYNWYLGVSSPTTSDLSFWASDADLALVANRGGAFSGEFLDRFARSDRPTNTSFGVGVLSLYNEATPKLTWRPGGGALAFELAYTHIFEIFESRTLGCRQPEFKDLPICDQRSIAAADYTVDRLKIESRWRFFPKTGALLELSGELRSYPNSTAGAPASVPTTPIRAQVGLAGLLTPKLAIILKAGYGDTLVANGYRSVIGHAEVDYSPAETMQLKLGYVRNFDGVASQLTYVGDNRAFLSAALLLGGRLGAKGGVTFDHLTYGGGTGRNDQNLEVTATLEYEFFPWLRSSLGYTFTYHDAVNSGLTLGAQYSRNEFGARVTAEY